MAMDINTIKTMLEMHQHIEIVLFNESGDCRYGMKGDTFEGFDKVKTRSEILGIEETEPAQEKVGKKKQS
jgi:hypothetical protein